jgi:hypothetical protein
MAVVHVTLVGLLALLATSLSSALPAQFQLDRTAATRTTQGKSTSPPSTKRRKR